MVVCHGDKSINIYKLIINILKLLRWCHCYTQKYDKIVGKVQRKYKCKKCHSFIEIK